MMWFELNMTVLCLIR